AGFALAVPKFVTKLC
ncbi:hypothetical protein D043_1732B, partial [Vibrio parahaemolyticus EKP-021]